MLRLHRGPSALHLPTSAPQRGRHHRLWRPPGRGGAAGAAAPVPRAADCAAGPCSGKGTAAAAPHPPLSLPSPAHHPWSPHQLATAFRASTMADALTFTLTKAVSRLSRDAGVPRTDFSKSASSMQAPTEFAEGFEAAAALRLAQRASHSRWRGRALTAATIASAALTRAGSRTACGRLSARGQRLLLLTWLRPV